MLSVLSLTAGVRAEQLNNSSQSLTIDQRYLFIVIDYEKLKSGVIKNATISQIVDSQLNDASDAVPSSFLDKAVQYVSSNRLKSPSSKQPAGNYRTWIVYDLEKPSNYSIPPEQHFLDQISERGRQIAEYDKASYLATDALLAKAPSDFHKQMQTPPYGSYVAQKVDGKWQVAFGKLAKDGSSYSILALATQKRKTTKYKVKFYKQPLVDTGEWLKLSVALRTAMANFKPLAPKYNTVILKDDDKLIAYMLPARIDQHHYPLGGDYRITFSGEDYKTIDVTPLHKSVLKLKLNRKDVVSSISSSVLFSHPVETEVFFVQQWNRLPTPHYLAAGSGLYKINIDGRIEVINFWRHSELGAEWSDDIPIRFIAKLKED